MSSVYEVGPFRVDPRAGAINCHGVPQALGPRGVAVFAALLDRPKAIVTKREIMQLAWPGLVVAQTNLTVQIAAIRRVLEQMPGGGRWIETVARRGYRFVGPVVEVHDGIARERRRGPYSNLPISLSSFVGRERELVELKRLLARSRLLTLVGLGGVGKTRLALQLAEDVRDAFRDGSYFVDLAPLIQDEMIPAAAARAFDLQLGPRESPRDALEIFAKDRQLLVVLDNCEHLLDGAARLAHSLLRASRETTIVTTSREPLRTDGEQLYRLQPLSLPKLDATPRALEQSEAAQLFIARAHAQDAHFVVDETFAFTIASICSRLDGIPLAIELAAAQLHALSIDDIDDRLADRFALLIHGSRTAMPRQQTLRAALDWSYGLLTPAHRSAWMNLSVFTGGFTLDAATAVIGGRPEGERNPRDTLDALVARSLVNVLSVAQGTRYYLLETLRTYALEQLDAAGQSAPARRLHAAYYCALLDNAGTEWCSATEADWLARYAPEIDNVRAALDWLMVAGDDPDVIVRLAGSAGPLFMALSLPVEGRQRLDAASTLATPGMKPLDRARLWLWSGLLGEAEPEHALECYERAEQLFKAARNALWRGDALMRKARMLSQLGRADAADNSLNAARPLLERSGFPLMLANYHSTRGYVRMRAGKLKEARAAETRALTYFRKAGIEHAAHQTLGNLANLNWATGELDQAIVLFRESIARRRASRNGRKSSLGFALANLAGVLIEKGELDEATSTLRECVPLLLAAGLAWIHLDHLAHHQARAGSMIHAAFIAGRADSEYAARGIAREINETRARAAVQKLLGLHFEPTKLRDLLHEGGRLTTSEVCRLVVE